ncbi:M20 family metallopeptidase [Marmoricola sp. URHB0036]|uniref:M20 metallopeptidase family protein n=1 Tax=Marmoricola sp. URHB0036 TaxID=1298863 RepID=UPI0004070169|nr:M20 family metallopeptidase [Marmoricola sp. URHB0036]
MQPILDRAHEIAPDLIDLRRELHRVPELDRDLPKTQALVLRALEGLDLDITTGTALSSVTAVLRGGAHDGIGPVVLLRGDMDALPVTEETGLEFSSEQPGQMHACGHDLHVAALVGAARLLCERRDELAGDVVLMWQPAEETTAGAMAMIDEGVLEAAGRPTDAAYCLHVMSSGRPLGTWFSRPGPLWGASDEFIVRVVGVGGHGSAPHMTRDPIPVACEMVTALQTLVTRRVDINDPVVLTVGKFAAGTKENIIPDDAVFEATIRSFSRANRDLLEGAVRRLLEGIADAHGLRAEIEWTPGYPVTINDENEYAFARATLTDLFGEGRYDEEQFADPGTEDFSYVLERVPGAYVSISACAADDPATAADNHSARAVFDDSVLGDCAGYLAEVATRRIERG